MDIVDYTAIKCNDTHRFYIHIMGKITQ